MNKIISIITIILLSLSISACSNSNSNVEYQDLDTNETQLVNGLQITNIQKFKLNNLKDYEIYVEHYQDNKLVKKYEYVLANEKDNEIKSSGPYLFSTSPINNTDNNYKIYFIEYNSGVVYPQEVIKTKYKSLDAHSVSENKELKKGKNIIESIFVNKNNNDNPNQYESISLIVDIK